MLIFLLFCLFASILANPILVSRSNENRTLDQIYQAALLENGILRIAWGGDTKISEQRIIKAFQKKYPGIQVALRLDLSKYLDSYLDRIYEASDGTDDGADIAVLQSLHDFTRWSGEERLLPYKAAQFNDVYPQFVDPDGAYTGCFISTFGSIIYNPKLTHNTSLPTTYADFLKPEWKNRLILTYPNDDDAILYLFTLIVKKYGFDFMDSLVKNQNPRWARGSATPSLLIGQTNVTKNAQSVSFASSSAFTSNVAFTAPEDTYMAWPQTAAIFATTKVPESAKLFLNFLLDDEWQSGVSGGKFSVRKKHDRAGIFKQKHVEPLGYMKFMADREEVERWRFQFESILGPPQGLNPVKVV